MCTITERGDQMRRVESEADPGEDDTEEGLRNTLKQARDEAKELGGCQAFKDCK
jgi:hypothetical protein